MLNDIKHKVTQTLDANSPAILAGVGASGVVSTAYLSGLATVKAVNTIDVCLDRGGVLTRKDRFKLVWRFYIPTAISGTLAISCIIASTKIGAKRAAAAYSLLSVSERSFREYQEKIIEKIGPNKERQARDEIMQDQVRAMDSSIIVIGSDKVLCYEQHTGRYFESDMVSLRKAVNVINAQILNEDMARLDDFYHEVGLPGTSYSENVGWWNDKLLDLRFSTVLTPDGRPCLAFEYNYVKPIN